MEIVPRLIQLSPNKSGHLAHEIIVIAGQAVPIETGQQMNRIP
jgi:hypothetical protein